MCVLSIPLGRNSLTEHCGLWRSSINNQTIFQNPREISYRKPIKSFACLCSGKWSSEREREGEKGQLSLWGFSIRKEANTHMEMISHLCALRSLVSHKWLMVMRWLVWPRWQLEEIQRAASLFLHPPRSVHWVSVLIRWMITAWWEISIGPIKWIREEERRNSLVAAGKWRGLQHETWKSFMAIRAAAMLFSMIRNRSLLLLWAICCQSRWLLNCICQ